MADPELVRILKEDGVDAWNEFARQKGLGWRPDLSCAEIPDLSDANLGRLNLSGAMLSGTYIDGANLYGTKLNHADLQHAYLQNADLREAELRGANLQNAYLRGADLRLAKLNGSDLRGADLTVSIFAATDLDAANLGDAQFGFGYLADLDLSSVNGLASASHIFSSYLDHTTLSQSRGKIPDDFLRGCGFQEWEILSARLHDPDLSDDCRIGIAYEVATLSAKAPILPNPVFISYTHADSLFVDQLQAALDKRSIRSWRDARDAEAGPLEKVINRAISLNPTMVLVLSRASCGSSWVRYEIAKALELEQQLRRAVLCPVAIDDAWLTALPAQQREEVMRYNVLDLSAPDAIEKQMPRLLKGLHIHYRGETPGE